MDGVVATKQNFFSGGGSSCNGEYGNKRGAKYYKSTAFANSRVQAVTHMENKGAVLFSSADVRDASDCYKLVACPSGGIVSGVACPDGTDGTFPANTNVVKTAQCSVTELATFTGSKLRRTKLAVRRVVSQHDSTWAESQNDLMGTSSSIIHYGHSDRWYLAVAHHDGIVEYIDVTSTAASPDSTGGWTSMVVSGGESTGTELTPAVSQAPATPVDGIVATAVEGTAPRMIISGTKAYIFTIFMRLWEVDLSQYLPCGNLLKFIRPNVAAWSVAAGSSSSDAHTMCLRSDIAAANSALVAWRCKASKKAEHESVSNTGMTKTTVCCSPEVAAAGAGTTCCSEKATGTVSSITTAQATALGDALALL
jgi:hypothetical protein